MRHSRILLLVLAGVVGLAGCEDPKDAEVKRAKEAVNAIDESDLNQLMLTSTDPDEAVRYFERSVAENPDRIDLKRGLAMSLVRNKQVRTSIPFWQQVVDSDEVTNEDRLGLADAHIRLGEWDKAEAALNTVPPTYETFRRYRLEAMVADSNQQWKKADSFYEVALGLTTQPANVLNNWGYSKLSRGDYKGAEQLFFEALSYEPNMFTAKNNIPLARGAQRNYTLPVVHLTQSERAQLLYTLGLAAVKQGDTETAKGLFKDAVETHPQHFDEAARALAALENNVVQG